MFRGKPILKGFTVPNGYELSITSGDNPRTVQTGEYSGGPYTYQQVASGEIEGWDLQPVQGASQQQTQSLPAQSLQQRQSAPQQPQQPSGAQYIDSLSNEEKGRLYEHVTENLGLNYRDFYVGASVGRHSAQEIQSMLQGVPQPRQEKEEPKQEVNSSQPATADDYESVIESDPVMRRNFVDYITRNKIGSEDEFYDELVNGNVTKQDFDKFCKEATEFSPVDYVSVLDDDIAASVAESLGVGDTKEDLLYAVERSQITDDELRSYTEDAESLNKINSSANKSKVDSGFGTRFSGIDLGDFVGNFDNLKMLNDVTGEKIDDPSFIASMIGCEDYETFTNTVFPKGMGIDLENAQHVLTIEEDEDGNQYVNATVRFSHESGEYMGEVSFHFKGETHHVDCIELDKQFNKSGIGSTIYKNLENHLKKMGTKSMSLIANVSVGGYAWAKLGYNFENQKEVEYIKYRIRGQINSDIDELEKPQYNSLISQLEAAKTAEDFANIELPLNNEKYRYGKRGMLGSDWTGVKTL